MVNGFNKSIKIWIRPYLFHRPFWRKALVIAGRSPVTLRSLLSSKFLVQSPITLHLPCRRPLYIYHSVSFRCQIYLHINGLTVRAQGSVPISLLSVKPGAQNWRYNMGLYSSRWGLDLVTSLRLRWRTFTNVLVVSPNVLISQSTGTNHNPVMTMSPQLIVQSIISIL